MTNPDRMSLPAPLVPAEVDLRDTPIPLAAFVELAMAEFGLTREQAERELRAIAQALGYAVEKVGHA